MIDIPAIRARIDIVALIRERVKLTKQGKDWYGSCPFHTGDRTPSFAVVPAKGFFHCHGCGAHGDALDFVMRTENLTLIQAAERLGGAKASSETNRRLATEKRQREREARIVAERERAVIDLEYEATAWLPAWGAWLAGMGITPPCL